VTMHDDLVERVCVLAAQDEIRRLMAAYVHARDLANIPVVDYLTEDAVWEGVGRMADVLGRHAIAKRFAGPVPPGLHLLTNESITVNGDDAVGYWTCTTRCPATGAAGPRSTCLTVSSSR